MNTNRLFWPSLIVVALVAAFGGFVRFLIATNDLLWLDELHTSWVVSGGISEVLPRAAQGNQTPLFYFLTWPLVALLGESELSIRIVGLLAGIATIIAVGHLVFRWTASFLGAVVAAILVTLDFQFILYATEARPYSMLQFLSVVQVGCFWSTFSKPNQDSGGRKLFGLRELGLVVATALLIYTHYTAVWLFVAEGVFFAGWLAKNSEFRKSNLKRAFLCVAIVALACTPILIQMLGVFGRRSNWSSISSIEGVLRENLLPVGFWIGIPLIALLIMFGIRNFGSGKPVSSKADSDASFEPQDNSLGGLLSFTIGWALIPIAAVILMDFFKIAPMALNRYTLVGSAAMPVFAGLVIGSLSDRKIRLGLASILIAASFLHSPITSGKFASSGFQLEHTPRIRTENWQAPIDAINLDESKRDQPVFLASNLIEDVDAFTNLDSDFQEYLLFPISGLYRINRDSNEEDLPNLIACPTGLREHFRKSDIDLIKQSGGCWVLLRGTPAWAAEFEDEILRKFAELYPAVGEPIVKRFQRPGSVVYLLSLDW